MIDFKKMTHVSIIWRMCLLGRPATEKLFRSGFPTFRARRTLSLRAFSVKSSISILWLAGIEEAQKRIDQAKKNVQCYWRTKIRNVVCPRQSPLFSRRSMSFNTHPLQVIRKKSYANSYLILRSGMYWNCWNLHWIFRQNKQDTSPRIRVFRLRHNFAQERPVSRWSR